MSRVLLVHEDGDERRALQAVLEAEGHQVLLVTTRVHAVAALGHLRVDQVLANATSAEEALRLPAVLRRTRPGLPVVLITSARLSVDEMRRANATAVLRKPFALEDLHLALECAARDAPCAARPRGELCS